MKMYKNIDVFIDKQKESINWEDEMVIGGKIYRIYEYGGGSMFHLDYDYAYFVNKRTHNAIYIKYHCPASQHVNGEKVITRKYQFLDAEYIEDMDLWRTDTLKN